MHESFINCLGNYCDLFRVGLLCVEDIPNASSYLCDLGTEVCYNIIYEQNYKE